MAARSLFRHFGQPLWRDDLEPSVIRCLTVRFAGPLSAAVLVAASAGQGALAQPKGPIPMASHHATYKLSLLKSKGSNAPASAAGIIDYVFSGSACDGYTTTFRQMTELQPAEGDARLNDLRSTTFEDAAGTQYTFKTVSKNDSDTVNDIDGRAKKLADGRTTVEIKPATEMSALGADVLFPTEHLRKVIATAEDGGRLLEASVYDGSDTGKKVYHTLSVIGPAIDTPSSDPAGHDQALAGMRRWPVSISYFDAGKEEQPDYVLSFDLYENGISRALKLDYGDFVLSGELTSLSVNAPTPCK